MKVGNRHYRSIELAPDGWGVEITDQRKLPFEFRRVVLQSPEEVETAIKEMWVRGAPLIGAAAAYGMALAMRRDPSDDLLKAAYKSLLASRPTAVNLKWALDSVMERLKPLKPEDREKAAYARAAAICDEDAELCKSIGVHGLALIKKLYEAKGRKGNFNILTHCNAGWLATVDYGTALAPIYMAHDEGIPVHVWVDETRPRNQGYLTAWELESHGVPCTLITDNAGGHIMQRGMVDICIVGTDRTTIAGDVCNKIGTYLKALAAKDNNIPFYVALPYTSLDRSIKDAFAEIPIEERRGEEISRITGKDESGNLRELALTSASRVVNHAFDVTPARLVTGFITEEGVVKSLREKELK